MTAMPDLRHLGSGVVRTAQIAADHPDPVPTLAAMLGDQPLGLLILHASPEADFTGLMRDAARLYPDVCVIGCTTAGEIGEAGYTEHEIVAVGFAAKHFAASCLVIEDLDDIEPTALIDRMVRCRAQLAEEAPGLTHEFAYLMVDGLSVKEDALTSAMSIGLGPVPLFGGSAGDGIRFAQTSVGHGAEALTNAAVLTFLRTDCPVKVFSLDHLVPTETRMVVTEADPERRIVRGINAAPAAREYARILGKDPMQLSAFTFAAHPLVVKVGGTHHVRAIQQVAPNGDLVFFSAIDEGLVLRLAEPQDMAAHLAGALEDLARPGTPELILACDCILRRLEAEQKQLTRQVSATLARHRVRGFSTYGEQMNTLHVNQTMTGVAIYSPMDAAAP